MLNVDDRITIADDELQFSFARSGGPGGQNVNKVASKATLRWNPGTSASLPEPVRQRLLRLIAPRLTTEGDLLITSSLTRDQSRNVDDCLEKLRALILSVAVPPKTRRPTRPTLASKRRRVESKARRSDLKQGRKKPAADY